MAREGFGKPKHGGAKYRSFKLVQGSNVYRIGPAFKSLAAAGKWFVYHKQHFGYRAAGDEQNPKGYIKTFLCNQEIDRKTEMVKVPCAECDMIDMQKALLEKREADLEAEVKAGTKTQAQVDSLLGPIKGWLKDHNLDKKYVVLACNDKGEWGLLYLPYKAKSGLDNLIKEVQKSEGFDPIDPDNGCWIDFQRTGEGFKTEYKVVALQEAEIINGRRLYSTKMHQLTDADYDNILANCPDLTTIGRKLTVEQVEELVESGGDPEVVSQVFGRGEASPKETSPAKAAPAKKPTPPAVQDLADEPEPEEEVAAPPAGRVVKVKEEVTEVTTTYVREEEDEEAAMERKLAELKAKKAAAAALVEAAGNKPPVKVEVPDAVPNNVKDLPDAEFMAVFKKKKAAQQG
jgi:hypothetical protein